jgi:hypothetical protein
MMMRQTPFLLVLASFLARSVLGGTADDYCCLCDDCFGPDPSKYDFRVDSDQYGVKTCVELDYQMSVNLAPTSNTCTSERDAAYNCCCTGATSGCSSEEAPPTPAPRSNFPAGNEPFCSLCINGQFPLNPYTVTAVAYIPGNPSCQDLYWMGQTFNIPSALCYPIQNFMAEPCGCLPTDAPTPAAPTPTTPTPNDPVANEMKTPKDWNREDFKIGEIGLVSGIMTSTHGRVLPETEDENA